MIERIAAWSRRTRILAGIAAGIVVVAGMTTLGVSVYSATVLPRIQQARAQSCADRYDSAVARHACLRGDTDAAARTQKKEDARARTSRECEARYTADAAVRDCARGEGAAAEAAQKASDDAAAKAAKELTRGSRYNDPDPAGTKEPMQSTNRLDGTRVGYTEWITGFTADWRGYDEFEAPTSGHKYVAFTVHVKADDAGVDAAGAAYDTSFTAPDGTVYEQATATYEAKPQMPDVTLGAGQQASGVVVFEVPTAVKTGVATFGDGTVFVALG